ncbi:ATP-binding cassette domain-containing protein [Pendulispora albinea]|uniref:ABC transporter ATP-binding protein/permease n=1 Tax=Pendulispora albinea TaxID=2741071 RepID=A0ABZ2LLQ5_9BACT
MTRAIAAFGWPMARVGEALESLAQSAGFPPALHCLAVRTSANTDPTGSIPVGGVDGGPTTSRVEYAASVLGLEVESLSATHADIDFLVRQAAPALLLVHAEEATYVIAIIESTRKRARVVTPDPTVRSVPLEDVRKALYFAAEREHGPAVEALLEHVPLSARRRPLVRSALLRERVGELPLDAGWSLRLSRSAPFHAQLRRAGVLRTLRTMTFAHVVGFVLSLLAWRVIGVGILGGHLDRGWLVAWALLLATLIPVRVMTTWWQGAANIATGFLLKQRMLLGTLKLDPEDIRHQGMGAILGRVIEVDALEELAMHGGFVSLVAFVELAITIPVLGFGPGSTASVLLLFVCIAFLALFLRRVAKQWLTWSSGRIAMTNQMIEGMLGHRTRIAQEPPRGWHVAEDHALAAYCEDGRNLDRSGTLITGLPPRVWLLLGVVALGPALIAETTSPEAIALGIGGVLLARGAIVRLTSGVMSLVAALAAWRQAAPLFHAGGRPCPVPSRHSPRSGEERNERGSTGLLDLRNVVFRHRLKGKPTLHDITLRIHRGDRLLVEGPSGGGKSTFGSVLAGLREPESGLVLLDGLDRASLGADAWRRRIAAAPQFHENHVLSDTFAFNLLMGRCWPPRPEDLVEAETICRELGLGALLDRMPGGLMQRVGETGWQLSCTRPR